MGFKDLWFAEMERLTAEFEDRGIPPEAAYDMACDRAYDSARDRLADAADQLRDRAKEERLAARDK